MNLNDGKDLESRMRSWKPRSPSRRVAKRLFGPAESARERLLSSRWLARWLAPTLAVACTVLVARMPVQDAWLEASYRPISYADACVEPDLSTYLDGRVHSRVNGLWRQSFGWTNHSHSPSSNAAFSLHSTNEPNR